MKIFVVKHFDKFMIKHKISDSDICNLVNQLKEGLIDADLGGGVIKIFPFLYMDIVKVSKPILIKKN